MPPPDPQPDPPTVPPAEPTTQPMGDAEPTATHSLRPDHSGLPAAALLIDRYRIVERLGEGGMGVVYRAIDESLGRQVALKLMKPGHHSDRARRRFKDEAKLLGRFTHPGIAIIYDHGTYAPDGFGPASQPPPADYIVMELIHAARPITDFARARGLSTLDRVALFIKVCEAVDHAHEKNLVHRDLKPGNILVNERAEPKVIDFGVARDIDARGLPAHLLTEDGQLVGTPHYMSPEQVGGEVDAVDKRSDVYSLGFVLYELLLDRWPYDLTNKGPLAIARIVRETPPTPPSLVDASLPPDLGQILLKALQKDRHARYQSARALADDLARFLRGEPLAETRGDLTILLTRTRSGLARRRRLALAGIVALATLFSVALGSAILPETTAIALQRLRWKLFDLPDTVQSFDHARLLALSPSTDLAALIARERIDGKPDELATLRALHARLLDRLARTGARAIAWDIHFKSPSDFDDLLRRAAQIQFPNASLTFAVVNWTEQALGRPTPGGPIPLPGRRGGVSIGLPPNPYVELAVFRPDVRPLPSLALDAFASFRDPHAEYTLDLGSSDLVLSSVNHTALPPVVIPLSAIFTQPARPDPEDADVGLRAGDRVAALAASPPDERTLAPAIVDFQAAFESDDDQFRRWFDGRIVVVHDLRDPTDHHLDPDSGRDIAGSTFNLVAVELLARYGTLAPASGLAQTAFAGVFAVAGLALAGRRVWAQALGALTATLSASAVAILLLHNLQVWLTPFTACSAIFMAWAASSTLGRALRTASPSRAGSTAT